MFQFSGLAAQTYGLGLRLFGNLRIKACLTAPRSFSQFSAPFKAFRRQDVPHALFLRLIAPIHHSLRNIRIGLFSVLSIYYRNVFSTPCEAEKTNSPTDRAVSDPPDSRSVQFSNALDRLASSLDATFAPLGLTRANRSTFDSFSTTKFRRM